MSKKNPFLLTSLALACLCTTQAWAEEAKKADTNKGKVSASIKAMTILDAKDNRYDPNDGSAYLATLKFESPEWNRLTAGAGMYITGDLFGMTDFDTERVARGMFVTNDGSRDAQLGELYLKYQAESFGFNLGRTLYETPLTTAASSTTPNFYTSYGVSTKAIEGFDISLSQVTEMSFGARAMTEFGLIGEATGTAGAVFKPSVVGQAEFHKISQVLMGATAPSTDGMTVFNVNYTGMKGVGLSLWDYYVDEFVNNVYLEGHKVMPMGGGKLKMEGQYLTQSDTGASLKGDKDFDMLGLKATYMGKGWAVYGAYNQSGGDTAMLNGWGGDPAYTSSIFSRNAYRENVSAYKIGGKYMISKELALMASYANYGESDTLAPLAALGAGSTGMASAQTDADEIDVVLVYKPKPNMMLKLFHARRTSEYDGINGADLTQAHTRLIFDYTFK